MSEKSRTSYSKIFNVAAKVVASSVIGIAAGIGMYELVPESGYNAIAGFATIPFASIASYLFMNRNKSSSVEPDSKSKPLSEEIIDNNDSQGKELEEGKSKESQKLINKDIWDHAYGGFSGFVNGMIVRNLILNRSGAIMSEDVARILGEPAGALLGFHNYNRTSIGNAFIRAQKNTSSKLPELQKNMKDHAYGAISAAGNGFFVGKVTAVLTTYLSGNSTAGIVLGLITAAPAFYTNYNRASIGNSFMRHNPENTVTEIEHPKPS